MVEEQWLPKISQEDCCSVICKKLSVNNFTVLNYYQQCFDKMNGYLGDHSSLSIEIEINSKKEKFKFFVKSLPHVESQKTFLLEFNGFFKEKQFFTKYLAVLKDYSINLLDDVIPTCYFVNDEFFIFEDLGSKGFETLPSRVPLKLDCIKTGLITLSKLHASGLILEELKVFRLIDDFAEELGESLYLGTGAAERGVRCCKTGLQALIDMTHTEETKISKDLFTFKTLEGCDLQTFFTKPSTKYRNTICHADPWTKNFMFKFEEGKAINCVAVDFQTYRYGPPAQDVLAFIYLVSDRETRDGHLDELLRFYYEELRANFEKFNLEMVVGEEEFFESCDYFKRFALTQNLMHFQVVILADEIADELFADPENAEKVIFENRYEFIKETCRRDEVFKQRNYELMEELREFYEKQLM